MKLSNNTVLITGGSSGLGLSLAGYLSESGNTVIICGRSVQRLESARKRYPQLQIIPCDISDADQCIELTQQMKTQFDHLNVLINNAAIVHKTSFMDNPEIIGHAEAEFQTNVLAPIRLTHQLLPILKQNSDPAVINITTGLIYAPRAVYPFYNATKAALHAFTQTLRVQLESTSVEVIEAMYPVVDTPWHNGNPPKIAVSAESAVDGLIRGLRKGKSEIRIGAVKKLYAISRLSPRLAMKVINAVSQD